MEKLPREFDERKALETRLWAQAEKYNVAKDRPLKFQTLVTFADLMSEQSLSHDQIDRLAKGSVMYMMTILKDGRGEAVITSCVHTDPAGGNLFFCIAHNNRDPPLSNALSALELRVVARDKKLTEEASSLFGERGRFLNGPNSRDLFINLRQAANSKVFISAVSGSLGYLPPHPAKHTKHIKTMQDALRRALLLFPRRVHQPAGRRVDQR